MVSWSIVQKDHKYLISLYILQSSNGKSMLCLYTWRKYSHHSAQYPQITDFQKQSFTGMNVKVGQNLYVVFTNTFLSLPALSCFFPDIPDLYYPFQSAGGGLDERTGVRGHTDVRT